MGYAPSVSQCAQGNWSKAGKMYKAVVATPEADVSTGAKARSGGSQ